MTADNRIENLERIISTLVEQVSRVATSMERLAVIEERNSKLDDKIDFIRTEAAKANEVTKDKVVEIKLGFKEVEQSLIKLRIDVTRLVTIVGVVAVVIEPIAIFLIGKLL